jgi:hypothetical protein
MLVFASTANPQTERRQPGAPAETTIQVGTVTERSPAVSLSAIGREVAPGVLEVDPGAVRGKRLTLPRGDQAQAKKLCIGKWSNGECKGIYLEW